MSINAYAPLFEANVIDDSNSGCVIILRYTGTYRDHSVQLITGIAKASPEVAILDR